MGGLYNGSKYLLNHYKTISLLGKIMEEEVKMIVMSIDIREFFNVDSINCCRIIFY